MSLPIKKEHHYLSRVAALYLQGYLVYCHYAASLATTSPLVLPLHMIGALFALLLGPNPRFSAAILLALWLLPLLQAAKSLGVVIGRHSVFCLWSRTVLHLYGIFQRR